MTKVVWSHSALKDYEGCPRRYQEVRVLKNYAFQETEATKYGTQLHLAAEEYIRDGKELPEQFAFIKDTLDALNKKPGRKLCEHKMALTIDKEPCDFDDENRWVRGIVDLLIVDGDSAYIVDYKTGNNKYADPKQLKLMALMTYAHFPEVQHIKAGLLFVMHNTFVTEEYERKDSEKLWQNFLPNLDQLALSYENNMWFAKPGPLCGWCPVSNCKFYREK